MNKKGEAIVGVGLFVMAAVAIIVGLTLFDASADQIGTATNTGSTANITVTVGNAGTFVDIPGQELISTPIIYNATGAIVLVNNNNFTITERISSVSGLKRIGITPIGVSSYNGSAINLSYTFGPEGYIDDSGGRSVASLVLIFFGLAVAVIALVPTLRSGVLGMLGK